MNFNFEENENSFANILNKYLKEINSSQKDLADITKLNKTLINRLSTGQKFPKIMMIK